jgi:dihydrolipoamide dehydrogenase
MADTEFDVIVVGSGPGGYIAAIRARQLGLRAAIVERDALGGICLNWGCIPTKALLRASEIQHLLRHLDDFGFQASDVRFDLAKLVARSRAVAKRLSAGVKHLMKKNGIPVFEGRGQLAGKGLVRVEREGAAALELTAPHVVLATGARARGLPGLEADGERIWTYKEAMLPKSLPASLLVVGSGAIGVEFASFYRDLGAEVTLVEILPRILPAEDEEIAAAAHKAFTKQGIRIRTQTTLVSATRDADQVAVVLRGENGLTETLRFERVILAVGITGNVENLGLEGTAVRSERGHIVVNEWLETDEPGVHAIGDVVGPPWLAHKASHEGVICVERIAGFAGAHPLDVSKVPGCTYCRPQIASVGYSEQRARELGHEVRVGRFPFLANGKALALGESEGFVKTVFDARSGELLGAHMIGSEVTELIQGFAIARTLETTEAELMRTVFAHPTLSEALHESVLDAYGRALNS